MMAVAWLPSNVDPPEACTVILFVASSPLVPFTQNVCPAIDAEELHCGNVSVLADDVELFHTIVPTVVVALIRPFEIVRVVPSGLTIPNELVVASPGVTARDQWSAPSELAQT